MYSMKAAFVSKVTFEAEMTDFDKYPVWLSCLQNKGGNLKVFFVTAPKSTDEDVKKFYTSPSFRICT